MSSSEADTAQYPASTTCHDHPPVPDPDTASRDRDSTLVSSNPFGETNVSFLARELYLRPWLQVKSCEWSEDRVRVLTRVTIIQPFLEFVRLIAVGLLPFSRAVECRYIPCSDDEHWFALQVGWRFPEEKSLVIDALSNALWQIPV